MGAISDDQLPKAFGDYTLLKPLGRGGMGQVFLAQLRARGLAGVDKVCVVKTLRSTDDPEYERRFIDEARLIVLLSHKNICPVFDAGCFEGQYYLALEHIAGREVRRVQLDCEARGAPLPTPVVLHVLKETLEALDAAHRMVHPLTGAPLRVVHRDVSPQNVMISHEGEVKLIDFGLAVSSQKVEQTAPQVVMGKMAYMAPEQARGEAVDARVDQFAAGIMLYELLTNTRYYDAMPIEAMWRMSGVGGHVPSRLAALDKDLQEIILKATAPRRDDRFPTCGDMRDAITAAELRRGAVAGSREVRAALADLDGVALSSPSVPVLKRPSVTPAPPATPSTPEPPPPSAFELPRERTRTFRLVVPASSSDHGEVGIVEGAEPGALITNEHVRPVLPSRLDTAIDGAALGTDSESDINTAIASALDPEIDTESSIAAPKPPVAMPATAATARVPRAAEATVLVRTSTPEPSAPPSRRGAMVAAGLAALVLVGGLLMLRDGGTVDDVGPPPPSSIVGVVGVSAIDAGSPVIDAGVAAVPDDAGIAADPVVDAGPPDDGDAGVEVPAVEDPAVIDAGPSASDPPPNRRRPRPKTREPARQIPPLPAGTLDLRTGLLNKHCSDVPCTSSLRGMALVEKLNRGRVDEVEAEVRRCHRICETTPRP